MSPESKTVRYAIVGTGMIAAYHRDAIAALSDEGAVLGAVVHHDRSRFEEISSRFGVPCVTLEEALANPEIDAVSLCTPSGQHALQAMAAAAAGKQVLVEKPIATTLEDADHMIDACQRAGVLLGVVFQRRAEPAFRAIFEALRDGKLGTLTLGILTMPYFRSQSYYDSAAWRGTIALDGGGVLMNQGIHLIDLLVWYLGDPMEVRAYTSTLHRAIEVEDLAAAVLRFQNGAVATITGTTTAAPGFPHRLELYGTGGGIQIEGESIVRWTRADGSSVVASSNGPADAGAGGSPGGISIAGHVGVFRNFTRAVLHGEPLLVDGPEARRSLRAVLQIYEAARSSS